MLVDTSATQLIDRMETPSTSMEGALRVREFVDASLIAGLATNIEDYFHLLVAPVMLRGPWLDVMGDSDPGAYPREVLLPQIRLGNKKAAS